MTNWSKIGRKSRNKGARFERRIAKILSDSTKFTFQRTPLSGGMHWKGDIQLIDGQYKFPFIIECKNWHLDINTEFSNGFKTISGWLSDNLESGHPRIFVLIMSMYNKKICGIIRNSVIADIEPDEYLYDISPSFEVDCSQFYVLSLEHTINYIKSNIREKRGQK